MQTYILALIITLALSTVFSKRMTEKEELLRERESGTARLYCYKSFLSAFVAMSPLTLVVCFRWDVGIDSAYGRSYSIAYHMAALGENVRGFETGYYILSRLFAGAHAPWFWFLFSLSLLYMVCVSYGIYKASVSPVLSVLGFVFLMTYFDSFSALRQSIAQGICIADMGWWLSRELNQDGEDERKAEVKFLLIIILASFFHRIAFLYFAMHFICRKAFSKRSVIKACIIGVLLSPIIRIVAVEMLRRFTGGRYVSEGFASSYTLIALVIFTLAVMEQDRMVNVNPHAVYLTNHAMCSLILMLNSSALVLPYRFFDMLKVTYIFTIPLIIKSAQSNAKRFLYFLILSVMIGVWFWNAMYGQENILIRYQTVFSDWERIIRLP